ncbi:MAG: MoaD/ThiS family protein [Nitrospinae bacterium]|nr:MoaD/ThiS family protein [Nitrospinota bacterium]
MDSIMIKLDAPMELSLFLFAVARQAEVRPSQIQNPHLLYSINGEMADLNSMVGDTDEVAVIPPLSGGL